MNRFLLVCYSYFLDLFAINGSSLFCFYKEFEQVNAGWDAIICNYWRISHSAEIKRSIKKLLAREKCICSYSEADLGLLQHPRWNALW